MAAHASVDAFIDAATEARLEAEVLLDHVTGLNRAALVARPERVLDVDALAALEALVARRLSGEPVAYVVGTREFWSMAFAVEPGVLIPRPDTETLVERALAHVSTDPSGLVLEAGTGSGAVAVALASECPNAILATDIEPIALSVASANARRLVGEARVRFVRADWLAPFADASLAVLVSNPPYLAADDPHLPALHAEPRTALVAGDGGLGALARLVAEGRRVVRPGGAVLLEHGAIQGEAVRALFERHGYIRVRTHRDLAGLERTTEGVVP